MRIRIPNIFTDPDQDLALIPSPSHLISPSSPLLLPSSFLLPHPFSFVPHLSSSYLMSPPAPILLPHISHLVP